MPSNAPKFLIRFLLTVGFYETDFELFQTGKLVGAFKKGNLIEDEEKV